MIIDYLAQLYDGVAMTSSEDSTILDLEVANPQPGPGTPIWVHCKVSATFSSASSGTLNVALKSCATSNGTYTTHFTSPTWTVGQLVKGLDMLTVPLPMDVLRYVKLATTNATATLNTGTIDAFLALHAPRD